VGNLLQDSYNEVVDNDEADDSELSDVTFARRPRGLNRGVGEKGWLSGTCSLSHSNPLARHLVKGFWTGNWGCDLCTKDSSAETKLWGQAFAASLLASGDEAFRSIKSCTIEMEVASRRDDDGVTPNVDIHVHCGKNLDINSLSVAQGTYRYLAHAVQRSYGKAHDVIDDSSLDYVIYSATAAFADIAASSSVAEMSLTRRRRRSYSMLGFIIGDCSRERPCPNDDLMYGAVAAIQGFLGSAALVAWQNELVAALRESNFSTFRKVTKCTIKMLPVKVVEIENTANETGGVRGGCALEA
jgi:hypothetical protein